MVVVGKNERERECLTRSEEVWDVLVFQLQDSLSAGGDLQTGSEPHLIG